MSQHTRQRLTFAVLVILAVWPIAHHLLVRRYEVNPWKFFGWSMYCLPVGDLAARFFPVEGGGVPLSWRGGQPRVVSDALTDYLNRRRVWGLLLPPDEVAERVFDTAPELTKFRIRLQEAVLDPASARWVTRERDYVYQRTPAGEVVISQAP